jgi:hypothetical protein
MQRQQNIQVIFIPDRYSGVRAEGEVEGVLLAERR